jgi:hypothetical protein
MRDPPQRATSFHANRISCHFFSIVRIWRMVRGNSICVKGCGGWRGGIMRQVSPSSHPNLSCKKEPGGLSHVNKLGPTFLFVSSARGAIWRSIPSSLLQLRKKNKKILFVTKVIEFYIEWNNSKILTMYKGTAFRKYVLDRNTGKKIRPPLRNEKFCSIFLRLR